MTRRLLVAALSVGLLACVPAGLRRAAAPDLYTIDPPPPPPVTAGGAGPVVVVAAPRPLPGLDTRGMIYVQREHEVRYFSRSAWAEPPARMLAPLLARALERRGGFRVVPEAAADTPARLRLETELVRLRQEFTDHPSRVHLLLRVRLVDAAARRVLGEREIGAVEPAPTEDAYGGVVAANAAAARVVADVADACAAWWRGAAPTAPAGSAAP